MQRASFVRVLVFLSFVILITACASSPTGRRQLLLVPDAQVDAMGIQAFNEMQSSMQKSTDRVVTRQVDCIAQLLVRQLPAAYQQRPWDVEVFVDESANAFALPGQKIGIHTGMLKVATNQDQLAAVIGHEISHVIAKHANERLSTQLVLNQGMTLVDTFLNANETTKQSILGLLGIGSQVGVILPFSRFQETEADLFGQELMAKAGFNPVQATILWEKMAKGNQGSVPEFLSTHPASGSRIAKLKEHLAVTEPLYQQSINSGYKPICR